MLYLLVLQEISIGGSGSLINANNIYNTLKNEMNQYTNIKNTRCFVTMTGAGTQFGQTDIAHNTTSQRVTLNPSQPSNIQQGQVISESAMESFLSQLASAYTTERANTYTLTKTICHSSCHKFVPQLQRKKIMINTIVPIELKDLKKYFEDKTQSYQIDYLNSKLKGSVSNLFK